MSNNSENTNLQQNGETYLSKTEYGNKMNWLINEINRLSSNLKQDDRNVVISQQNNIDNILQQEKGRLLEKKTSVDLATQSQNRLITLNENYNKRMMEYLKMMGIIAISLAIIAITVGFNVRSSIIIIVSIISLSLSSIYCLTTYIRMRSRDNIYI